MKRSITLSGHRTSISLEKPFWDGLRDIASEEGLSPTDIITRIDHLRDPESNLSSAIRIHVLEFYRNKSTSKT